MPAASELKDRNEREPSSHPRYVITGTRSIEGIFPSDNFDQAGERSCHGSELFV